MPLISVIMPTYKVEEYLPQCLESVMNQDFQDIEIIPVDDGSPDSCGAIIDKYASQDKRIHPIHQKNGGYGKAVNAGMAKASGKYIVIVETDDYIEPDMLSVLYRVAEKYQASVVKAGFRKLYSDGGECIVHPPFLFYESEIKVEPQYSNDLMVMESSIWAALYNREFLEQYNIKVLESSGAAYQDVVFKFMVYSMAESIICIDKPVYNYRVMTANSSSKSAKNWDVQFKNYEVIKQWLAKNEKFGSFRDAFYLHAYFDFIFHYNRLSEESQEQFIERAREFYSEGKRNGVGAENARFSDSAVRQYYWDVVYPFLMGLDKTTADREKKLSVTDAQYWRNIVKNTLRNCYHTKAGIRIWDKINSFIHRPFIWNKINEGGYSSYASNQLQSLDFDNGIFELDPVCGEKTALVMVPWYQPNASIHYIEQIAITMKKKGYKLHLFIYWEQYAPQNVNRNVWDRVFFQHASNPYFSHSNYSENRMDADHIDDWVDADFLQSIVRLNEHYKYSACMANYLIYSKAFDVLSPAVKKILCTHDKFANHNKSLHNAGYPEWSFWFGVGTEEEEARALRRADVVLAIQEDDCKYFRRIVNNEVKIITFPFIPDKHQIKYKGIEDKDVMTVGYIASSNPPNYFSIKKIIAELGGTHNIHLYIAGSICDMLKEKDTSSSVTVLGRISSLDEFYSSYDLYLNPDTFYSGLKCKTLEALSYGVGIVCTKVASTGIGLVQEYHLLDTEKDCAQYLLNLSTKAYEERVNIVCSMKEESCEKYDEFCEKYPIDDLTEEMLGI